MTSISANPGVEELVARVRLARERGDRLRIVGAGTWLDAGQPCDAADQLNAGALKGIVTYEPGDLTLSARAGTSMSEIQQATAPEGQWLTLDPHGSLSGTIGATVATASAGPLSSAFGTPRDHVLGCEFVNGLGDVLQAGGRVVKNVAGFDLVRLATGAWGTVGALTEITVRLRARPEVDLTIAVSVSASTHEAIANVAWAWLRQSESAPLAAELISPELARRLSLPNQQLLMRIGGNESFVRAAQSRVSQVGESSVLNAPVWRALSDNEPATSVVVRLSALPSRIGSLWHRAVAFSEGLGGYAHATLVRGVVRCVIPVQTDEQSASRLRDGLQECTREFTVIGERLPAALWSVIGREKSSAALSAGVRRAFNPDGVMNPGILGTT